MIRDYFTKTLQGSQFRHFHNITIGIHEDGNTSYNASGLELLEVQKIKLDMKKKEAQKDATLACE